MAAGSGKILARMVAGSKTVDEAIHDSLDKGTI